MLTAPPSSDLRAESATPEHRGDTMGWLVAEVVGWFAELLLGTSSAPRRERRRLARVAEGFLRCELRMVHGKIPSLTREAANVELELAPGSVVCRRRDDRQRAIRLEPATLDPSTARPTDKTDPYLLRRDDTVVWLLTTPTAALELYGSSTVLLAAHALVHPESVPRSPST